MIQMMSETVIVSALRRGQVRRAVELMLDTYQDQVYSYCSRLTGAEDSGNVYHQVLVAAISELAAFDRSTTVRAWLFRVARRVIILHHQRSPQHHPQALEADYVPVAGVDDGGADEIPGPPAGGLSPAALEVLQLALWHRLYLIEVAHITGMPVKRVRSLAAAGLQALASLVHDSGVPPS
jgi:DNA-directed RNA polymerase specialized sigma24 family protein